MNFQPLRCALTAISISSTVVLSSQPPDSSNALILQTPAVPLKPKKFKNTPFTCCSTSKWKQRLMFCRRVSKFSSLFTNSHRACTNPSSGFPCKHSGDISHHNRWSGTKFQAILYAPWSVGLFAWENQDLVGNQHRKWQQIHSFLCNHSSWLSWDSLLYSQFLSIGADKQCWCLAGSTLKPQFQSEIWYPRRLNHQEPESTTDPSANQSHKRLISTARTPETRSKSAMEIQSRTETQDKMRASPLSHCTLEFEQEP